MKFYYVTDSYIEYLRKYDSRIYDNKAQSRPYIGIILTINNFNYYVSLSSPKPKHRKMSNSKDFRKINGGAYGALNFNYMIPVPESELILIDIAAIPDVKYRRLLQNQYNAIRSDWDNITATASNLYNLCIRSEAKLSAYDIRVKKRCCDFKRLEELCNEYK